MMDKRWGEAGYGCIKGRVTDADTGDPLSHAGIAVEGTNWSAATEEDGSFELCLPPGTYTLRVTFRGYEVVQCADIVVNRDATALLDFAMKPGVAGELPTTVVEGTKPYVDVKSSEVKTHKRGGELHVRGGRSGETSMFIEGVPVSESQPSPQISGIARGGEAEEAFGRLRPGTLIERPRRRCWWPPGIRPPGGEPFADMFFQHYGVNPFLATEDDALSTFAVDVDNASYTLTRSYIERGHLPPRDAVRVEEFVNFFDPGWPRVAEGDFALRADGMPSPHGEGYHLLRVGIQGREVGDDERLPANLVFVIDTSGSMARENRLELVKRALMVLMGELREGDTVGIVEYGSRGRIVLQPTGVEDREEIERAVLSLSPGGSTNAEEGLELGYMMAARRRDPGIINRIILCSDGVANTGETQAERILDRVRLESDRGVHLSAVGFGMGNYNDVLMEKLADQGDGNYHYVDRFEEARRVFRENLTGTLQTIARDAKVQVEFDEESVSRYRLLGYENRDVADEDFRNDAVDAGELGAGHTVTALYEIKLTEDAREALGRGRRPKHLATVRLRYELPAHHTRAGEVIELEREVTTRDLATSAERAKPGLRLAALAAEYAEILRRSYWARGATLGDLVGEARSLLEDFSGVSDVEDLVWLIRRAAELEERDARLGDPDRYERIGDDR
ncbi:MAG: von Willebrand factor type A domain-containing protein [Candidatus Krumholzibacteriota bacterium]|nr:von Willebrand factor type A domain-containing protein [Candidatus Krumholzibacteriota bacterium]